MHKHWKTRLAPAALGLVLITLAGCDAAEQSAQKLAEEAKKEAQALINDSVGEVVDEVNRQVDSLQDSTNRALGKDDKEQEQDAEAPQVEPEKPIEQGVET
ncbi:hypothetical protein SAMN05216601_10430 [Ectopseudomonas composti]|uniref:Lipoprotein n=1 Tax=Ectopseudomonas composti TaxID=658457 RepID=A0A1I5LK62_9GAMM|nr:hypothetical protein [Pseudomonas composti]EZH84051.1 hypothetical protein AU05_13360 [Pseudomonas composti]QNH08287.1 hypothetical protein HNQ27_10240 [Pseudomonas sp. B11D7D]SFO97585.1 hypothetical protein SAMN05216601_10430 [Pseudomonas composti]